MSLVLKKDVGRIRNSPGGDQTVILVVTGKNEPDILKSLLEAGANDYVAKLVDIALLNIRLAVAEREVRTQAERKATQQALLATTGELSTLFESLDEVFFSVDVPDDIMAKALGWDATRRAQQLDEYRDFAAEHGLPEV